MTITKATIDKVSRLANLKINDEPIDKFIKEFEETLNYVKILEEIDTAQVAPTYTVSDKQNVWRADEVKPSLPIEEVLKNAKRKYKNYFVANAVKGRK